MGAISDDEAASFTGFTRVPRTSSQGNAQPVINSAIELAGWDAFVIANRWPSGCALNVDTGENRLGLSMAEAAQLLARMRFLDHGITLLMSSLAGSGKADDVHSERQIARFSELHTPYYGRRRP